MIEEKKEQKQIGNKQRKELEGKKERREEGEKKTGSKQVKLKLQ